MVTEIRTEGWDGRGGAKPVVPVSVEITDPQPAVGYPLVVITAVGLQFVVVLTPALREAIASADGPIAQADGL